MSSQNVSLAPRDLSAQGQIQGWVQTDKKVHQELARLALEMPSANAILHLMVSRMNRGSSGVLITNEAIASFLGINTRTVERAVKLLKSKQFIQIIKAGKQNAYIINSKVAWQGKRGARYVSFHAEIIAHENDQNESVDQLIEDGKHLKHIPVLGIGERLYVTNNEIDPPDQNEMDLP